MSDAVHKQFKVLEQLLQKDVSFCINHKVLRRGRLLLYNVSDYHIKFTILTNKNINKYYELPFPFVVKKDGHNVILSYQIQDFCRGNDVKEAFVKSIAHENSKLYDQEIVISPV